MTVRATLGQCLQGCIGPQGADYSQLYTPQGGYLRYNGPQWSISRQMISEGDKPVEFAKISAQLCQEDILEVPQREELVKVINQFFIKTKDCQSGPNHADGIMFNSRVAGYVAFSNFFSTLIVDGKGHVYPSAEAYYQCQIINKLSERMGRAPQRPQDPTDPLKWKHMGEKMWQEYIQYNPQMAAAVNTLREEGMRQVVTRKFQQNPALQELLQRTKPHPLAELSAHDHFFGRDTLGNGENRLGRILMQIRDPQGNPS